MANARPGIIGSLLCCCLLGGFLAMPLNAADNRDLYEAREFKDGENGVLLYRLLKPQDYDPAKKYPLVLFLHGAGERGNDNRKQLMHGLNDFASPENREKYPAFVVAPQCPNGKQWVNAPWSAPAHDMPEKPAADLQRCFDLLAALQKEFSIDADRLYITGLSMGGYGTWDAIQRHPEMFAAAAPVCGGGDTAYAKVLVNTPLWVFHGGNDTVVKTARSRAMVEAIEKAGGKPKYTEYPGVGHNSWSATYVNPEFYAWLFEQKRP
ncbi:carboxylesterase family protein [Lignipirellula cremea]|uniref:Esterase n=1 Tax=Lignipirellula cremea TaxID=2528010 RepID=A0A518DUX2_9BACT|nr:prolyl oligopeptidase family serine peptidase [Lignipirellula cremea]QDU95628.1 esterase [Lignipirellula cremea]